MAIFVRNQEIFVVHRHCAMYVYAFLNAPVDEIELPMGIEASSTLVVCGALAALTEPALSTESLQQTDERLMRAVMDHDRVIQELFQTTTVLPLRFGTSFLSESHLMSHLQEKQENYCEQLEVLENKAEYLIKLLPYTYQPDNKPLDNKPIEKTGRNYFLAKKQRYEAQSSYQTQQQQELNDFCQFLQAQPCEMIQGKGDEEVERLFVLLQRSQESWFRQLLHNHTAHCWQIHIGDALPPYHFVR